MHGDSQFAEHVLEDVQLAAVRVELAGQSGDAWKLRDEQNAALQTLRHEIVDVFPRDLGGCPRDAPGRSGHFLI